MPKYYTNEFTKEQETQIEIVHNSVVALLDSMLAVPDYLKGTNIKGLKDFEDAPIPVSEVADTVANYLVARHTGNVFYPTHVEDEGEEWIQDTFNLNEVYEEPGAKLSDEQWLNAWNYLNFMIAEHVDDGDIGEYVLKEYLLPMKHRYDAGERSIELFNEIKAIEH